MGSNSEAGSGWVVHERRPVPLGASGRDCPDCATPGSVVAHALGPGEIAVIHDPEVECRSCGLQWTARGARFVFGKPPEGADEDDPWFDEFSRALGGGPVTLSVEQHEAGRMTADEGTVERYD